MVNIFINFIRKKCIGNSSKSIMCYGVQDMVKKYKKNSGLSFIELLFTLAILGITMISISSLLVNTSKINKKSELKYHATLLAQSYMENVKASDSIISELTIDTFEDTKIVVDIIEIDKYKSKFYKIIIEVLINEEVFERLEGYKIVTQ